MYACAATSYATTMASPFPRGMVILAGNSYPKLAEDVARRVGVPLGKANVYKEVDNEVEIRGILASLFDWFVQRLPNMIVAVSMATETQVEIMDSVRGKDVFIIQTGSCSSNPSSHADPYSTNDSIMELLIMCYACRTASARKVIGVIPYLPYCRQSKMRKRGCIAAKLLASMLAKSGMSHLITMDLYHKEIQGFFDIPVDNLRGSPFLVQYIKEQIPDYRNGVVVARYPGVTRKANAYAERLRLGLAVIHGEPKDLVEEEDGRNSPPLPEEEEVFKKEAITPSKSELLVIKEKPPLNVVGDVHGRIAIIIDDILDEVDRLVAAARCLKERGAYKIYAVGTHGIFAESALEQLEASPIDEVLVTNTVPHDKHSEQCRKIKTIDISLMLAEAIRRIYHGESMSYLFRNIPLED